MPSESSSRRARATHSARGATPTRAAARATCTHPPHTRRQRHEWACVSPPLTQPPPPPPPHALPAPHTCAKCGSRRWAAPVINTPNRTSPPTPLFVERTPIKPGGRVSQATRDGSIVSVHVHVKNQHAPVAGPNTPAHPCQCRAKKPSTPGTPSAYAIKPSTPRALAKNRSTQVAFAKAPTPAYAKTTHGPCTFVQKPHAR